MWVLPPIKLNIIIQRLKVVLNTNKHQTFIVQKIKSFLNAEFELNIYIIMKEMILDLFFNSIHQSPKEECYAQSSNSYYIFNYLFLLKINPLKKSIKTCSLFCKKILFDFHTSLTSLSLSEIGFVLSFKCLYTPAIKKRKLHYNFVT